MSMWDKSCTAKHKSNSIKGRILVVSMSIRVTNGSGLIYDRHGGKHTFRHIYTNKNVKKINANCVLMHEMVVAKWLMGGDAVGY